MISSLLCKILVIVILALLVVGAVLVFLRSKNTTRQDMKERIRKAQIFHISLLIFAIVIGGIFAIANHINMRQFTTAIISLNYSEASLAQNVNGTRYNMSEITCDEVLANAIKKGALEDVTVAELSQCLTVYPLVQGGSKDESEYHISTEFVIEYHSTKHTKHLDAENVIKLVASAYKEYYVNKYADNFTVQKINPETDFADLEYMDIVLYLNKTSNRILNYLYSLADKNSSFVTSNGSTFNSIVAKVYQLNETQINSNLKSYILQGGISKQPTGYIERLTYENKQLSFDKSKSAASFDVCNAAISMYSEEMTRVVLVPTWDSTGKYYMGRTKVGVDELSVEATRYSNAVASYEKSMQNNNLTISKMEGKSGTQSDASADQMISSICKTLDKFAAEACLAGTEYAAYRMNECMSVSITGASLIREIEYIALFLVAAYFAAFLLRFALKLPKKQ